MYMPKDCFLSQYKKSREDGLQSILNEYSGITPAMLDEADTYAEFNAEGVDCLK